MSFLNWFSKKQPPAKPPAGAQRDTSGLRERPAASGKQAHGPAAETPMPQRLAPSAEPSNTDSGNLRTQRYARREHLYLIIREAMTRMGVLSGSYKFKVLSVDPQGAEFMVMMDMMDMEENSAVFGSDKFHEMEGLIMQSAWSRFEVAVSAVYWRAGASLAASASASAATAHASASREKPSMSAHAGGAPALPRATFEPSGHQGLAHLGAPFSAPSQSAQPLHSPAPTPAAAGIPARKPMAATRFDPIEADEFSAFKEAMKAASPQYQTESATPVASKERVKTPSSKTSSIPFLRQSRKELPSYTLLTGFEETQLPDPGAYPEMSRTQYGDLR